MRQTRNIFEFTRQIKLAPAIGDWTTIQYRDDSLDEINISPIYNVNFDNLPKEQLRYVHYLHYRLAENMMKKFSEDMDIKVELHSIVASQLSYEDFLDSQTEKVVQTDFILDQSRRVNVLFDWSLANMMIDRLTGGKGHENNSNTFSEIEAAILKTQMEEVKPFFTDAWQSAVNESDVQLDFSYGPYKQDRKISLREAYVLFTFYFYFSKGDLRKVTFAYPNYILRRLLEVRKNINDPIKKRVNLSPETLSKTKIPVKTILGSNTITMSELKNLRAGDILPLKETLVEPLKVTIGKDTQLIGQPGVVGEKYCIQLLKKEERVQQQPQRQATVSPEPAVEAYSPPEETVDSVSRINLESVVAVEDATIPEPAVDTQGADIDIESTLEPMESPADSEEAAVQDDIQSDAPMAADFSETENTVSPEENSLDDDLFLDENEDDDEEDDEDDFSWDDLDDD